MSFTRSVRSYATAATKHTVPSIQLSGLSGKYATALFSAAIKRDALPAVEKDVTAIQKLLTSAKDGPGLRQFLQNPTLQPSARKQGLSQMLSKVGAGSNELTKNFFDVLAENGRLYESEKAIEDFVTLMSAHRGEVNITITSAQPLDASSQSRLEASLKKSTVAQGKTVKIKSAVNPALLGGLVIDFGDKTIDLSVASRVNKLNGLLTESI